MRTAVLLFCVWLAHSAGFADSAPQDQPRGVLDVVVFHADAPPHLQRYPSHVQRDLQRFVGRARAYRPRPRPARLGSEMRMFYAAREGYEAKLVAAAAPGAGVARLARDYVDALRPCYEWEGFHDCPESEALFAEQYVLDHPGTPFRDFLHLLAAHRWLCAAEAYDYERKPEKASQARRKYQDALKTAAMTSRSALMAAAADELKGSGRCYSSDPFRRR